MSIIPVDRTVTYTAHPFTEGFQESDHTVSWVFSDGQTASGMSVEKVWNAPGLVTATCRAKNNITKQIAIQTHNANVRYMDPGDIIVLITAPSSAKTGENIVFSATASRDIMPISGFKYEWQFTHALETRGHIGQTYNTQLGLAGTWDYTLTVTDLDRMDSTTVSGSLSITQDYVWGYQSSEEDGIYVYPDGEIYISPITNIAYCLNSDQTRILRFDPFEDGIELETIIPVGTTTFYSDIIMMPDGRILMYRLSGIKLWTLVYNPITKIWETNNESWTFERAPNSEIQMTILRDSVLSQGSIQYISGDNLIEKSIHIQYWWVGDGFNVTVYGYEIPKRVVTSGINKRFITWLPVTSGSSNEAKTLYTCDEDNGGMVGRATNTYYFGNPSSGNQWAFTNIVVIPDDPQGRFYCDLAETYNGLYQNYIKTLLINPASGSIDGVVTDWTANTTFSGCLNSDLLGQIWTRVGNNMVGIKGSSVACSGTNAHTTAAIINPSSLAITYLSTHAEVWGPTQYIQVNTSDQLQYNTILDRLFINTGRVTYTINGFPRIGEYYGESGLLQLTAPAITGNTSLSINANSVYHCASSNMYSSLGMHCEWSATPGLTLTTPEAGEINPYGMQEFSIKVTGSVGGGQTLTAHIYTKGAEINKTFSINVIDPNAINPISYGQTLYGTRYYDSPMDPVRGRQSTIYEFSATAGDVITITEIATPTNWDTFLGLYDSNLNRIAYDDDSAGNASSRISNFTIPDTGLYRIYASGYNAGGNESFNLTLTKA